MNRQITLVHRPVGMPKQSDFRIVESPVPHAGPGEALVRVLYLSLDPYMRGRMNDANSNSYARGVQIGEVMAGGAVGRVLESNDPRVQPDDIVEGMLGWQDYATAPAKCLHKIDAHSFPITTALYALGTPGLTAYFGLLEICHPSPGETVVISGAAGAVGSLVGQIARIKRCRAVGIAGSDEKIRYLTGDLGFEGGVNYKQSPDLYSRLKETCPNGIDIYFDNVGGPITDTVIRLINTHARIAICGQSSQYNAEQPEMGPRWLGQLIARQARMEGFQVTQFSARYDEGLRHLAAWLRENRLHYREEIVEGLDRAPEAFLSLLQGRHTGKLMVKLDGE
ncbi:MAG TPA: NADP-dependent oxidoreductase [Bryobacteraceae bacterium]|nr:NADP-dependent oxidoreductase [Bryobacteraceae bacterium]